MARLKIVLNTGSPNSTSQFFIDDDKMLCVHEKNGKVVSGTEAASALSAGDKICFEYVIGLEHNGSPIREISSIETV